MRITVRNLGVIKEAEVELKPLSIFVGPNNAGKTWLAYTLASIFGPYGFSQYLNTCEEDEILRAYPPLGEVFEGILKEGSAVLDLVLFVSQFGEVYFNNVVHSVRQWMAEYMSIQPASFDKLSISMGLKETKPVLLEGITILANVLASKLYQNAARGPLALAM